MCQPRSPSLKIVCELPRMAGISRTAMNNGNGDGLAVPGLAALANARALRRAVTIDRVEHQSDHLRREEEDLRPVGQADEQIEATEDTEWRDQPGRRGAKFALRF